MEKFNNGAPYHGSDYVTHGKLKGSTDETDYFYFFCPTCNDNEVLRILDYGVHAKESIKQYNAQCKSNAIYGFTLVFKLYCEKCGYNDFIKISNTGRQGGNFK